MCSTKALIWKFTSLPSAVLNYLTVDSKVSSYYNVHNYTLFYVKLQSEPDDQLNSAIFWQKKNNIEVWRNCQGVYELLFLYSDQILFHLYNKEKMQSQIIYQIVCVSNFKYLRFGSFKISFNILSNISNLPLYLVK